MRALAILLLLSAIVRGDIVAPTEWLAIGPVDARGRRPFNPDAIFRRYLLRADAPPPCAGEVVRGQEGTEDAWQPVRADPDGNVRGRIAYAYAPLTAGKDTVVLASLHGGATLFVNGVGHVGNIYGGRVPGVPVLLRAGRNDLYVRGVRGAFRLRMEEAAPGLVIASADATLPDLVAGQRYDTRAAVVVCNASTGPVASLSLGLQEGERVRNIELDHAGAVPLGVRKLHVAVRGRAPVDRDSVDIGVCVPWRIAQAFTLRVFPPGMPRRRTFVSAIDGSLQEYSVLPPSGAGGEERAGLVLTLHGAGVDAWGQARSYSQKPDLWVVAPTNRRPFGFDWQDWGRADAYEALADALALTRADPDRVYLTGHSMGGHGTWHLAANDPDRFAAIAPSAGWCSFDTYGGRPGGSLDPLWRGADGASLTMDLICNLAPQPVYILHGAADDNVPVTEALLMEHLLMNAGGVPAAHYEEGAGHWWDGSAAAGTDCVDWPGIFDHFRRHRRAALPRAVEFVSADPAVDSRHYWVTAHQPLVYGRPLRVRARCVGDVAEVTTDNVRRLFVAAPPEVARVRLDGSASTFDGGGWFLRTETGWVAAAPPPAEKGPARSGPFKRAFDRSFVLVYGEGDTASLARARYDAQVWWYRANGDAPIVTDARLLQGGFEGRNVILYGNATRNRAFASLLGPACPVRVTQGALALGESRWTGDDLACLFVYPRAGDDRAVIGVVGHTGAPGAQLGYTLLPFVSGVGYPDYALFDARVLDEGDGGVLAAGWFSHDWSLAR